MKIASYKYLYASFNNSDGMIVFRFELKLIQMRKSLELIPWILLYSRFLIALVFTFLGFFPGIYFSNESLCLFLFCFGFIGDIFDGIIARALKMDTTLMRRLDSLFDLLFWLSSTYLLYHYSGINKTVLASGFIAVILLVSIEYLASLVRFSKRPSSHNTLSKFFGLLLFSYYVLGFLEVDSTVFGITVFAFGFLARLDAMLIYFFLKKWTHDIPSIFHVKMINQGISFQRNKLFHSKDKERLSRQHS